MSTLQSLQEILIKDYRVPPEQVAPDVVLTTIGLDSLSVLELMFKIEDHFHVKIVEDTPTNLLTINDVVGFIDGLKAKQPATPVEAQARLSA
jgi:acyl carrier protein